LTQTTNQNPTQSSAPNFRTAGTFHKAFSGKSVVLEVGSERIYLPIEKLLQVIREERKEGTAYKREEMKGFP